jgi:DDE superfamily endonuclease
LSQTHEGKKHDKKICDEEPCVFPERKSLTGDLGFQGYEPAGTTLVLPFKKPRGGLLSDAQKDFNTMVASFRVKIEHIFSSVKRLRIVKDVFRNMRDDLRDTAMEIACALHNFRTRCRSGKAL